MSACVVEEGREEGGGACALESDLSVDRDEMPERPRREVLLSARGRRACSEQGPHPSLNFQHGTSHLWGANNSRRGWSRKRTSAPQMSNVHGSMPRVGLVLRSRRSWPVAPQSCRRTLLQLLLTTLLLQTTRGQDVTIDSLDDGPGLLPFKLGQTKILSHYHSFLNYINLTDISSQIDLVRTQLLDLKIKLNNKSSNTHYDPHIEHLSNKIDSISSQLHTFEPNRKKRGLIDGLGSIVKSITGNLDYSDAIKYDNAIKLLMDNQLKLRDEFNNHVSLNKDWTERNFKIMNSLVENQRKINKIINLLVKNVTDIEFNLIESSHLAQNLLILGDNIEDLSEELYKLGNTLAFIRASSTPHSIVSLDELKNMIIKVRTLYSPEQIFDVEYRDYYDIIKLGYFYLGSQIVIVFEVPIVFPVIYDLYKLSVIPNKNHKALIPTLPYLAISSQDSRYIETECPKINSWFLCETKSKYQIQDEPNCVQELITKQELHQSCKLTSVTLKNTALEQLDDKHYTMVFPNPTKVKITCGQEEYKTLLGSFLVAIPFSCQLKAPEFTISNTNDRIKGHVVKILEIPTYKNVNRDENPPVILSSINLENLHSINSKISQQAPVQLKETSGTFIYHTTIPIYTILLSASALVIGFICRRVYTDYLRRKTASENNVIALHPLPSSRSCDPSEIRVDHRNISATLSDKSSRSC